MSQPAIRVRVCLAALQGDRILLVPHYGTDAGPVQWNLPGGRLEFGERLRDAGLREFSEETGLIAEIIELLDASEVIIPDRPWHSITITFLARAVGGTLRDEIHPVYGSKMPRWLSLEDLADVPYHPPHVIRQALSRADQP